MLALGLLLFYVVRDLDECGLQFLLLFLLVQGAAAAVRDQPVRCGLCFAAASSYKATPVLLILYLLWKRQWKAPLAMLAFLVLFNFILPALAFGPERIGHENRRWLDHKIAYARLADPLLDMDISPKHQNLSLRAALARFLRTVHSAEKPFHHYHLDHPLFFQFGDLQPGRAGQVVAGLTLAMGAFFAWRVRVPWRSPPPPPPPPLRFPASEWAALFILLALISPYCWHQHLVLMLPGVYLLITRALRRGRLSPWESTLFIALFLTVWILQRGAWPRDLAVLILSYKFNTLTALALFFTLILRRDFTPDTPRSSASMPPTHAG